MQEVWDSIPEPVAGISPMSRVLGEERNWLGKRLLLLCQYCLGRLPRCGLGLPFCA